MDPFITLDETLCAKYKINKAIIIVFILTLFVSLINSTNFYCKAQSQALSI